MTFLRTMRKSKVPLKMVIGALAAGTATVGGVYAYRNMRSGPEHQKQEASPQLMPAFTLFDQNHTSQKIVLKCELECFPSEKKGENQHNKSENPSSTEHETKTNQHLQEKESKEAKPNHFPANSVKLVSDESSVPHESSEFPQKMNNLDAVSQDQDCLTLALVSNDDYQVAIMNLQQCEFATISAKQNEIQHRMKPRNSLHSSIDGYKDSKKCDCVKAVKEEEVILVEPINEAQPSKTNWFSKSFAQRDSQSESDKMDQQKCGCAQKNKVQQTEESTIKVNTKYWLGEENLLLKKCECAGCVIQDKLEQATAWLGGLFSNEENSSLGDKSEDSKITNNDSKMGYKKNETQNEVEQATEANSYKTNWSDSSFSQENKSSVIEDPRERSIQNRVEKRQKKPEKQEGKESVNKDSREKTCACNETKKTKEGLEILSTDQIVFAIDI